MDVRQKLHQMIDGLDDAQSAVVHDYLIWFLSREQETELTPEEQAAVDHDLAIIRRWQEEEHWVEGDDEDDGDDGIMFVDNGDGIIDIADAPDIFSTRRRRRNGPEA
ncbi:MAG: hypothetical protein ACRDJH_22005 [Thermomicrobiales bacterium]